MSSVDARVAKISSLVRTIPDFPEPGVQFRDITPLLADPDGFRETIDVLVGQLPGPIDVVVGIDSRGFLFGAPMALQMDVGFVPVRKPGKLPAPVFEEDYLLEYGSSSLNIHRDALRPGQRVLIVDDLLATGGTLGAAAKLVAREGAEIVHVETVIELAGLGGRKHLGECGVTSYSSILVC
ncbi:adenine phosphoribosyltransferase [Propionibacterium cyclohexanicum]|uniref:Adenine phosphoribosyltransferase n=1 Tax=Propionibacterium cyclohexanicum TaxID=64702 RepID=A0A1H9Q2Y9_9ACTN|nr:adenine phosphoribosyltransferase [Propionibacterium cyclohexanicum]SER54827.1 adenine phosphoribosyltransferase [Propionibacterium cyclohexanicum]